VLLPPGSRIGRYEILDHIGSGGMGVVYKARDEVLDRTVAVKLLPPEFISDPDRLRRFELEARATGRLNHPHIVSIFDAGLDGTQPYLVTELLDGETLGDRLAKGPLSVAAARQLTRQVAHALGAAHAQGVVHRDLKPDNILITREGTAKVLDFGLARIVSPGGRAGSQLTKTGTTPGVAMGTVGYMAPEQIEGREADPRADIFSLGVVLYEALTGQQPFRRPSVVDTLHAILHDEPPALPPQIPIGVQQILARCLQKQPDARFQSARDLEFALATVDSHGTASPATWVSSRLTGRARLALIAGLVILVAAAAWVLVRRNASPGGGDAASIRSIAVLPLEDLSQAHDQEYLADSLNDALITNLSQIEALRVIGRTSVMRYKGTNRPLQELSRELGVTGIVEGTIQRVGDRVRVSARLVHAGTGQHIWGEQYDREFGNLLVLQSELAATIANRIAVQVTPRERSRLAKAAVPIGRGSTQELYLRGKYFWNKRDPQSLQLALEAFQGAVKEDPTSARAWSGVADTYFYLGYAFGRMPPVDAMPRGLDAARRALELDPDLAEAHTSLGLIQLFYDWDREAAFASLRRALQLNPGYVVAHRGMAGALLCDRRPHEAIEHSKQAVQLDPVSLAENYFLSLCYVAARDYAAAESTARRSLELEPRHTPSIEMLGNIQITKGDVDKGVELIVESERISGSSPEHLARLTKAYKSGGLKAYRSLELEDMIKSWDGWHFMAFVIATKYAQIGNREASLLWLRRVRDARGAGLMLANNAPEFDPYRSDPEFREILGPAFSKR
jgi:eukaryotic-like serine/threonine-protein kinase